MNYLLNYKSLIKVAVITIVVALMASQMRETHAQRQHNADNVNVAPSVNVYVTNPVNLKNKRPLKVRVTNWEKNPCCCKEWINVSLSASGNQGEVLNYDIPTGKQLVIKHVSVSVEGLQEDIDEGLILNLSGVFNGEEVFECISGETQVVDRPSLTNPTRRLSWSTLTDVCFEDISDSIASDLTMTFKHTVLTESALSNNTIKKVSLKGCLIDIPLVLTDVDGDGFYLELGDCDDNDQSINPLALEICDGFDNNCNGLIDEGFDFDGDGFTSCGGDCDDNDQLINPLALEICDGFDNDCNGLIDEGIDVEEIPNNGIDDDCDGFVDEVD